MSLKVSIIEVYLVMILVLCSLLLVVCINASRRMSIHVIIRYYYLTPRPISPHGYKELSHYYLTKRFIIQLVSLLVWCQTAEWEVMFINCCQTTCNLAVSW